MAKLTGPEGVGFGASRSSGGIQGAPGKNVQSDFKSQAQINQAGINNIRKTLNMPKKPQEVINAVKKINDAKELKRIEHIKKRLKGLQ